MKGKVIMIVTIGIICILFTSIMFVQFKSVQVIEASGVGQKRETELRTEYSALKDKSNEMKQQLEEIQNTTKEYTDQSSDVQATMDLLKSDVDKARCDLGYTDVKGPGIVLTIADGKNAANDKEQVVTYNDLTNEDGLPIISGAKIPLKRKELDVGNIITLNSNYTIRFNSIGYYKISFTVFAYPNVDSLDFDPTKDIVSIGFKENNTDNVYVGASSWVWNGEAIEIYTSGIISVSNTNSLYELTNLSKETIYLNTPNIENISSTSYFSNSLVTLLIDYLGRD